MAELTRKEIQEEIFSQASMRAIVESYGIHINRNNTFICPFHNDTKPSMSIAKNDRYCKCFACGESGNVYTFIEKYEQQVNHRSLPSKEIFKLMVEKSNLNIDVSLLDRNEKIVALSPEQIKRNSLYKTMESMNKIYQYQLNTQTGLKAKEYLEKRNINKDIQEQFGIGYANEGLVQRVINKTEDTTIDKLNLTNIINNDEHGNIREVFKNRVVIPIKDDNGRIVAFGGRIIDADRKAPKYLNSKETEIFHKSNILFNYNNAKNYAMNGEMIVVEGYMDVVGANVLGYKNSVALMGVEISDQHINKLKRINSSVLLALDNDISGKKAMLKHIPKLTENNIDVSVLDISKIQKGKYKDFGDLSENNISKEEIENSKTSAFEYYFDNKYFNSKFDVDMIKSAFDSERNIMIKDTKDIIKYQSYIQNRTQFTKEEIQDIINPKKVEVLPQSEKSKFDKFKDVLFMNNLYIEIDNWLEKYNDNVLTTYYNNHKDELFNEMLKNFNSNPDKYINDGAVSLNIPLIINEVTENNVDYHKYEIINRFRHERAFNNCYVINEQSQQNEKIELSQEQKEMIVQQYNNTIDENAKLNLNNVEDIYIINSVNDLKHILPNDELLPIEIKEQMIKQMRELKKMEFFSYSMLFPEKQIPYMNKEFLTSDGKKYKSILLVYNFDKRMNINERNFIYSSNKISIDGNVEVLPPKDVISKDITAQKELTKVFTINNVLIKSKNDETIFTRIPNTNATKYMYLNKDKYVQLDEKTGQYTIDMNENIKIYDKSGNMTETLSAYEVMKYWEDKTKDKKVEVLPPKNIINTNNDITPQENITINNEIQENTIDNRSNDIIIPKFAVEQETRNGIYVATQKQNQFLFIHKDAINEVDTNNVYVNPNAKERMNIYEKDKNGKMKIIYGSVTKKTLQDIKTNKKDDGRWKYFHLNKSKLKRSGDFVQIPLKLDNKQGHVFVNQRFVTNGVLKFKDEFNYKFHDGTTNKTITLNELQRGFNDFVKHQKIIDNEKER